MPATLHLAVPPSGADGGAGGGAGGSAGGAFGIEEVRRMKPNRESSTGGKHDSVFVRSV